MSIPKDRASTAPVIGNILPPNDRFRPDLTAYHIGGIGIQDPSEGLEFQVWVAQGFTDRIDVFPESNPGSAQTFVSGATRIEFVALAFDQNMRPIIAYTDDGLTKLFWFDSDASDFVTTDFPSASSPYCIMDDTRDSATLTQRNDVLFLYLDGGLKYRQQRDRFQIERALSLVSSGRIARAGMTDKLRIQVEFE